MEEIIRSSDIILLGRAEALLTAAGIRCLVADQSMSALEGMIGAFPRRLLVAGEDAAAARRLLALDGLGSALRSPA
jgi:hypothetical protein